MKKIVVEPTSDIGMTQEDFNKLTGGIKFDRNDIPVKDVASDEDVIMNLCWENKKLKEILGKIDEETVKPLEKINLQYHHTLFDLFTIVDNLKLGKKVFDDSNLSVDRFVEVMNEAKKVLSGN